MVVPVTSMAGLGGRSGDRSALPGTDPRNLDSTATRDPRYDDTMTGAPFGDNWIDVAEHPLPVSEALEWAVVPACGAVVVFCGTVRDHSKGRPGVTSVEYEAYPEHVGPRVATVADAARRRWDTLGRLAILHRVGCLAVGEVSVVVVASAPHRSEAFEAARFCIDSVKVSVPIWKRESWAGGSDWGLCAHDIVDGGDLGAVAFPDDLGAPPISTQAAP